MPVAIDKPVPDFTAPATSGKEVTLSALKGKQVVLYFYPKDSTPGCTTEGQGFRDQYAAFQKANTEVFGIPRRPEVPRELQVQTGIPLRADQRQG